MFFNFWKIANLIYTKECSLEVREPKKTTAGLQIYRVVLKNEALYHSKIKRAQ